MMNWLFAGHSQSKKLRVTKLLYQVTLHSTVIDKSSMLHL